VADEKVKQLFNGQEMILFYVRAFGVGFAGCERACGIVLLHNENSSGCVELGVDLTENRVISIRASAVLLSEDPFKMFEFVEADPAQAAIKLKQPIPQEDFVAVVSQHGITVHYVEYVSNETRRGHGSVWEPFDPETLKAELESQGEELVGISSFFGLAKSEDWVEFLQIDTDFASLEWLTIRGSNPAE
jgi:hypothetical protein